MLKTQVMLELVKFDRFRLLPHKTYHKAGWIAALVKTNNDLGAWDASDTQADYVACLLILLIRSVSGAQMANRCPLEISSHASAPSVINWGGSPEARAQPRYQLFLSARPDALESVVKSTLAWWLARRAHNCHKSAANHCEIVSDSWGERPT